MNKLLLAAAMVASLLLAACQADSGEVDEDGSSEQAAAPVTIPPVPTTADDNAWKAYFTAVVKANMDGINESPRYNYYIPAGTDPEEEGGAFSRQVEQVNGVALRGVLPGNLITFGSPDSNLTALLIERAFVGAKADALKGSRVVFIGLIEDDARVRPLIEGAGAEYRFVEAK